MRKVRRKNSSGSRYSSLALAAVDLGEVGRELGLLVAAGGHVRVRGDDLAPGREVRVAASLGGFDAAALGAGLLGELGAQYVPCVASTSRACSAAEIGLQEEPHGVEGAVGLVGGEWLVVGPVVADALQLVDERPLRRPRVRPKTRATGPT